MIGLKVHPTFWLLAAVYGFSAGAGDLATILTWVAVIALSVGAHELGHALTMVAFGSGADIELHGFGGSTMPRRSQELPVWKRAAITLNGCVVGLLLAGLANLALRRHPSVFWLAMLQVNLYWSVLNLLPIHPLDGGKLLELILTSWFGRWGKRLALASSVLAAGAIAVYFLRRGSRYNAALTALFALSGLRRLQAELGRLPQDDDEGILAEFDTAQNLRREGRPEEASKALIALRKKAVQGELYAASTEQLARWFYADKQNGAAYVLLKDLGDKLSPGSRLILQHLAYEAGSWEECIVLGRRVFLEESDPQAAYLIALASLKQGDELAALRWLKTAVRGGLAEPAARLRNPELSSLRSFPEFQALVDSLQS